MSLDTIAGRLELAKQEIREAAKAVGRDPESVQLIAVSKLHPIDAVNQASACGQTEFGENHVQEMVAKHEDRPDLHWHMIGSLQRNKVKYIASFVHLIHSVDSARLLEEINKQGEKAGRVVPCLLQINISDEPQKGGFQEQEAEELLQNIEAYPWVRIQGLMGMAAFTGDKELIRNQFRRLKEASTTFAPYAGPRITMETLSMGMSSDFEIAVAEGATMVRIGSSIFGSRT